MPSRSTASEPPPEPLRILVVEDDSMIREALRRTLERRGHTVHEAPDVSRADALLEEHAFDRVVVDLGVPGDGATVLRRLEGDPDFRGSAILMTGRIPADPSSEVGADLPRLQKPFRFRDAVPLIEGRVP